MTVLSNLTPIQIRALIKLNTPSGKPEGSEGLKGQRRGNGCRLIRRVSGGAKHRVALANGTRAEPTSG